MKAQHRDDGSCPSNTNPEATKLSLSPPELPSVCQSAESVSKSERVYVRVLEEDGWVSSSLPSHWE